MRGKRAFGDFQQVEFNRGRVAVLKLVDAVQIGQQRLGGRALGVELFGPGVGVIANAEGAKQAVHIHQFGAQDFSQFALRQAAHHFHLKQPVLRMHVAQRAVHVGLAGGLDVRHAAFVITHGDLGPEVFQGQRTRTLRQLGVHIPSGCSPGHDADEGQQQGENFQDAFHQSVVLRRVFPGQGS